MNRRLCLKGYCDPRLFGFGEAKYANGSKRAIDLKGMSQNATRFLWCSIKIATEFCFNQWAIN